LPFRLFGLVGTRRRHSRLARLAGSQSQGTHKNQQSHAKRFKYQHVFSIKGGFKYAFQHGLKAGKKIRAAF
jgi:hypothetical protein